MCPSWSVASASNSVAVHRTVHCLPRDLSDTENPGCRHRETDSRGISTAMKGATQLAKHLAGHTFA